MLLTVAQNLQNEHNLKTRCSSFSLPETFCSVCGRHSSTEAEVRDGFCCQSPARHHTPTYRISHAPPDGDENVAAVLILHDVSLDMSCVCSLHRDDHQRISTDMNRFSSHSLSFGPRFCLCWWVTQSPTVFSARLATAASRDCVWSWVWPCSLAIGFCKW